MIIIHGEDVVSSRNRLQELLTEVKLANKEVVKLEGKKVTLTEIKQALEAQSLFGQERAVVVEQLLGRQQSKDKEAILEYLSKEDLGKLDLYSWDDKQLTATQLKGFGKAKVQEFKLPQVLWQFLDGLKPGQAKYTLGLFEKVIEHQPVEMVFGLLIKRLRYLVVARIEGQKGLGGFKELQGWQQGKMMAQARQFSEEKLKNLGAEMLEMDYKRKTGKTNLGLTEGLELIIGQI